MLYKIKHFLHKVKLFSRLVLVSEMHYTKRLEVKQSRVNQACNDRQMLVNILMSIIYGMELANPIEPGKSSWGDIISTCICN